MKTHKIMFLSMLVTGTLMTISSNSWMGMWMGLEINLMSMIPLMSDSLLINSPESMIKYFLVQSISSSMIMLSIILESLKFNFNSYMNNDSNLMIFMNCGLLVKIGAAPFHFWFPEVLEGISWMNCFMLISWQKIAPMIILMYNMEWNFFIFMVISISMIFSSIISFNQSSMRKIIAYSSINNVGWMIASLLLSKLIWIIFMIVYSTINMIIITTLDEKKIYSIDQLNSNTQNSYKISFLLNFLSLAGIPPFMGFINKWLIIYTISMNHMFTLCYIMITFSVVMTYIYMKISLNMLIMASSKMKWLMNNKKTNSWIIIYNIPNLFSLIIMTLMSNMT